MKLCIYIKFESGIFLGEKTNCPDYQKMNLRITELKANSTLKKIAIEGLGAKTLVVSDDFRPIFIFPQN